LTKPLGDVAPADESGVFRSSDAVMAVPASLEVLCGTMAGEEATPELGSGLTTFEAATAEA
jgi:hypothetical protein